MKRMHAIKEQMVFLRLFQQNIVPFFVLLSIVLTYPSNSLGVTYCSNLFYGTNINHTIDLWASRYKNKELKNPADPHSFSANEMFDTLIDLKFELETIKHQITALDANHLYKSATLELIKTVQFYIKNGLTYRDLIYISVQAARFFSSIETDRGGYTPYKLLTAEEIGRTYFMTDHVLLKDFIENAGLFFLMPIVKSDGHLPDNIYFESGGRPVDFIQISRKSITAHNTLLHPMRFLIHDLDHAYFNSLKHRKMSDQEGQSYLRWRENLVKTIHSLHESQLKNSLIILVNVLEHDMSGFVDIDSLIRLQNDHWWSTLYIDLKAKYENIDTAVNWLLKYLSDTSR